MFVPWRVQGNTGKFRPNRTRSGQIMIHQPRFPEIFGDFRKPYLYLLEKNRSRFRSLGNLTRPDRLHPWKLTCPLKIDGWKMYSLLKWSLFRGHSLVFRGAFIWEWQPMLSELPRLWTCWMPLLLSQHQPVSVVTLPLEHGEVHRGSFPRGCQEVQGAGWVGWVEWGRRRCCWWFVTFMSIWMARTDVFRYIILIIQVC